LVADLDCACLAAATDVPQPLTALIFYTKQKKFLQGLQEKLIIGPFKVLPNNADLSHNLFNLKKTKGSPCG
jgi:hypothetical protein